ncbi:EamA family transporter [Terrimonas pollutisoli]|uniref:EamA family transporter n=1 Tax=Terrimonas pollutisoli TaxID=3034147 RepID=UPI0023EB4E3C|nr:EamA family transporter [Terrimonas sp. H1YJ31]
MKFQLKIVLAFAAIYIIWGSTYLAILFAIHDIPPLLMSGLRFMAAGILLFGCCTWKGEKLPGYSSFLKNSFCGILMLLGGTGAVAWSEQYIPSGLAAVIVTTVPFWFILLDKKQWPFYFSNKSIIPGLLLGFAGVLLLLFFNTSGTTLTIYSGKSLLGILVIILGGIAWTTGSLYSKYKPTGDSLLVNATVQLLVAGAVSFLISIFTGESRNFSFATVSMNAWLALLYLVIAGSLIAYLCYLWLLKVKTAAQVSSYVYVNPVVAVLLGALIAGEEVTPIQRVSLLLILLGVWLVNLPKYKVVSKPKLSAT